MLGLLSGLHSDNGQDDLALTAAQDALLVYRDILTQHPSCPKATLHMTYGLRDLGDLYLDANKFDEALCTYSERVSELRKLLGRTSSDANTTSTLEQSLAVAADLQHEQGNFDSASRYEVEAFDVANKLPEQALADALVDTGDAQSERGYYGLALAAFEEALSLRRSVLESDPISVKWLQAVWRSLHHVGEISRLLGEFDAALALFSEALSFARSLSDRDLTDERRIEDVCSSLEAIALIHDTREQSELALVALNESIQLRRLLRAQDPVRRRWMRQLASSVEWRAQIHFQRKMPELSLEDFDEALSLQRLRRERDLTSVTLRRAVLKTMFLVRSVGQSLGRTLPEDVRAEMKTHIDWALQLEDNSRDVELLQAYVRSLSDL